MQKISRKFQVLLPIAVIMLVTIACGTSANTGQKVGEVETVTESAAAVEATPSKSVFTVGDIVGLNDHTIAVNSVEYTTGLVKVNLTVENTGTSDLTVSSIMSFSAKSDDGTKLESEIFDCGTSLDGSVLPGDKLRGDLCYKLAAPGLFKVYYESSLFSSGAVVWEFDTNNLPAAVEPATASADMANVNKIGDIIKLSDSTIVLNSADFSNNLLKANFTIENLGTDDLNVSSLMSFTAKGPDGTKLEMEIFDCGTSIDGTVLPGDKIKGDVCYKTGGASPIKLYYESSLLSSGAIVWLVE
jgi:hypothetical protein